MTPANHSGTAAGLLRVELNDELFLHQRVDLLSEFDVVWRQHYGARVSAAGWYDYAYRNSDVKQNPALSELPSSYHDKQYSRGWLSR